MDFRPLSKLKGLPIPLGAMKIFSESNASLDEFVKAWEQRKRAQQRFMVCGFNWEGDVLNPVGVLVDEIKNAGQTLSGELLSNSRSRSIAGRGTIARGCVLDWSYVDLWTLRGGAACKALIKNPDAIVKRSILDTQWRIFRYEDPANQTEEQRELLRSILNDEEGGCKELLERSPLEPIPLNTPPYARNSYIVPYAFAIQEPVAKFGSYRLIKELCEHNWFDFNVKHPPVMVAAMVNNLESVKAFIESGVDVNTVDYTDRTLISAVASFNCKETVRWLLDHGADVNMVDNCSRNALWGVEDLEVALWIIDAGVNLRHSTDSGRNLFDHFLEEGRFEIAQLMVDRGVGDQAILDRAKPSGTPEQRGRKIIYEAAMKSEQENIDVMYAVDYGLVLPFRSIHAKTGMINY